MIPTRARLPNRRPSHLETLEVDGHITPAAKRQRRRRERKRRGLVLARAEVPDQIVEALVNQGVLREAQATDARAIGKALVDVAKKSVTP